MCVYVSGVGGFLIAWVIFICFFWWEGDIFRCKKFLFCFSSLYFFNVEALEYFRMLGWIGCLVVLVYFGVV